jgi:signal transduction histidine kinase
VPRTRVAADAGLSTARFDSSVEAAVYFCCLEALQNAGKHANAAAITVRLSCHSGCLWFSVMDDGHGFEPATARVGSGLRNMTDRLAALGGTLVVDAAVGRGTTVTGRLPLVGEGTAAAILALPELHTGKPKARV